MPRPVRQARAFRGPDLMPVEWSWLLGLPNPPGEDGADYWSLDFDGGRLFRDGRPSRAALIDQYGQQAVQEVARRRPGTRPPWWWALPGAPVRLPGESQGACLRRTRYLLPGEARMMPEAARVLRDIRRPRRTKRSRTGCRLDLGGGT